MGQTSPFLSKIIIFHSNLEQIRAQIFNTQKVNIALGKKINFGRVVGGEEERERDRKGIKYNI